MTPVGRWSVVAALALAVVAGPLAPRLLPASDTEVSAAELLAQIHASTDVAYSGYVETDGAVQLPVGDDLGDVGELLASRTRLRVWWQDDGAWRVDRLEVSGERDLVHAGDQTISYDYEDAQAEVTSDPETRLPRASDLLPPQLARTVLEDAVPDDVRRIGARTVAGIDAPGLRYTPPAGTSTVGRVDVWADPGSGLPLRVEVSAVGADRSAVVTGFEEVAVERPADDRVQFRPSGDVEVERRDAVDIADAAGRYAPFLVPQELAGLERRTTQDGAVGVYGSGVQRFIALPLRSREADPLRERLRSAPGATVGDERVVAADGVLTVLMTGDDDGRGASWLVAGTVSPQVLEQAAAVLVELDFIESRDSGG